MKRLYFLFFIIILLIDCSPEKEDALSYATYSYTEEVQPPVSVDVLKVTKSALIPGIKASGIIEGINEITVISETRGIIQKLEFELGEYLEKGDILLSVDNQISGLNKDQAKLELDSAFIDFESAKQFYNSGSISQADYIKAGSLYNTRKAQYETALKAYNDCTIRSPIGGYVAAKFDEVSTGSYITPGTRIARIVNTDSFLLKIGVGERQVALIKKGQNADVRISALKKNVEAHVSAVAGASNRDTGSFQVVLIWQNNGDPMVKSGMSASVEIHTAETEAEVIIPVIALTARDGKEYVFVAEDDQAKAVEIVAGEMSGDRIEIISGLKQDDLLIITRVNTLKPGQNIIAFNQGTSGEWR